eukprot:gnl/TRDRNA2_/TRDRNA2_192772_c0_seq1.p1 gnl/TRDRNA2_/TRDRNA2_192772_c0~~gnl/TRDRNA2_/TRDRNA2_192772_c0_seq1.p1  ORF type:complete len:231 (+),score=23.70 gnl/TRDRNA2_/TRDRNA2_192772_c0_seq1:85-777(+)
MAKFGSIRAVLLAVPQIFGYVRAMLYVTAFAIVDGAAPLGGVGLNVPGWVVCVFLYFIGFALDAIDGMAARALDQCSILGGVLDMVLDRAGTAALLTTLAGAFPAFRLHFAGLVALDVGSHWMHVASCQLEPNRGHHKAAESLKHRNFILRTYYGIYPLFGYCCVGCEMFYITLLALAYAPVAAIGPLTLSGFAWYACFPACFMKNIVNVMQLWSAMCALAALDVPAKSD